MKICVCKTCKKPFLQDDGKAYSYCRICYANWKKDQEKKREEAENLKWQEQKRRNQELFEREIQRRNPVEMDSIVSSDRTLYIIGNGFDLMHRVPSSYYSFQDSIGKHNELRNMLEMALTPDDIWADFERALGKQDLDLMGSRYVIDMWLDDLGFFEEDAGAAEYYMAVESAANPIIKIVSKLQNSFRRWVSQLEVGTDDRPLEQLICPNAKVLNFNYTEFVETLYNVDDVCYIHGCRKNKKQRLILGHKPGAEGKLNEKSRKPHSYRQAVINAAQDDVLDLIGKYDEKLTKDCQAIINDNRSFFEGLNMIDQVVVIGHSVSDVDWDYFFEVNKSVHNAHWYFGVYGLNDLNNIEQMTGKMCLKNYNFFRTDDINTKSKKISITKQLLPNKPQQIIVEKCGITISISNYYDILIDNDFELILPNRVKNTVIIDNHIFIVLNDLEKNILLFNKQDDKWTFVTRLEKPENQSIINRRLNHVFLTDSDITFVYNNRVRKYDLITGEMNFNHQVRDAKSMKFGGIEIIDMFLRTE